MKMYNIKVEQLSDDALRAQRDQVLISEYTERVNKEPDVARSTIMERIAADTGLTTKTVRQVLKQYGCETAMGNYRNSGVRTN